MPLTPLLELKNIRFSYPGAEPLYDGLNFSMGEGEHLGFFGHNGQGKTTFFRLVTGLEKPQAGTIRFEGREITDEKGLQDLRKKVGYVLQQADDQLFCPTVIEDVAFGPLNLGFSADEAREKAERVLRALGLAGFEDRLTPRLSGGEKKLVSLAGVLVMEPKLLLFDEPTASLDPRARERLLEVVQDLPQARIVISHDQPFLRAVSASYLTLEQGTLVRRKDCGDFFPG